MQVSDEVRDVLSQAQRALAAHGANAPGLLEWFGLCRRLTKQLDHMVKLVDGRRSGRQKRTSPSPKTNRAVQQRLVGFNFELTTMDYAIDRINDAREPGERITQIETIHDGRGMTTGFAVLFEEVAP